MVTKLIDADDSAGLDTKDDSGMTALMHSVNYGHADKVKELIDANVNYNLKDNSGLTALMHSVLIHSDSRKTL